MRAITGTPGQARGLPELRPFGARTILYSASLWHLWLLCGRQDASGCREVPGQSAALGCRSGALKRLCRSAKTVLNLCESVSNRARFTLILLRGFCARFTPIEA